MWLGENKKKSNASSIVDALKTVNEKVINYIYIDKIGIS